MNRTLNCILMLVYLQSGRVYKAKELASLLEKDTLESVNVRNIIEYKKELEYAGYNIRSIPGKYGGYKLDTQSLFPVISLTDEEKTTLSMAYGYLRERNDFLRKDELDLVIGKIMSSVSGEKDLHSTMVINHYPLSMGEDELKERYEFMLDAINARRQIKIKYRSLKNVEKEHIFDPYDLFMYNNAWFVIGFRSGEHLNDIMYFKLNRISEYKTTGKSFRVLRTFRKSDYIDDFGFKNNGEWYHIEFEAYGQYAALVRERTYGKNQEVIPIDETTTIVKVDMQNKDNILKFILGFGENAKVIEPLWLKGEIVSAVSAIRKKYDEEK